MHETICPRQDFYERAKIDDFADRTLVDLTDFGFCRYPVDLINRFAHRVAISGRNVDCTVIFNINLYTGFFDDRTNHLATWADEVANLLSSHFEGQNPRSVFRCLAT